MLRLTRFHLPLTLASAFVLSSAARAQMQPASPASSVKSQGMRAFAKVEVAFQWPGFVGDPFDYKRHDVRVRVRTPGGEIVSLPAFFDGGVTWRARHTPDAMGVYKIVGVFNNGRELKSLRAQPQFWDVDAASKASNDWVSIDKRNPRRFSLSDGARFYPFGVNVAWINDGHGPYEKKFELLQKAGLNWARVWMNNWDGKDLVWSKPDGMPVGQIDLEAARTWDSILESADRHGIYVQMTIQYHGAFSLRTNPNWEKNPYNIVNKGGFLRSPAEFFTSERARELTKRKLRYIVARYGYAPNVMAWELWNEVQFTAGGQEGKWDAVAAWHREMADFLREQDNYDHLVTTSSEVPPAVYAPVDYYQHHAYPIYQIPVLSQPHFAGKEWPVKPEFVGEFGPDQTQDRPDEWTMHSGLWAGLMSDAGGAAQYWKGGQVEEKNWYFHFAAISAFLAQSEFTRHDEQNPTGPAPLVISTPEKGDLKLTFSGGWSTVKQTEFDLSDSDSIGAFSRLPTFFQGENHRDMNSQPIQIKMNLPQPAVLTLKLKQIAKAGANLRISSGGKVVNHPFPATQSDTKTDREIAIPVAAGPQTVTLENTGQDWIVLSHLTIPGAAPALDGRVRANREWMMGWFYHAANIESAEPQGSASGTALIKNLDAGTYRVTWWDTLTGKSLKAETVRAADDGLNLQIPPIARDIAVWAQKTE